MKKIMLGVAAMAMVAISFAQPPAEGRKDHKKEGRAGFQNRRQPHARQGVAFNKLNLTDAQKEQLKALNQDYRKQMRELNAKEDITVKEQRTQRAALAKAHRANVEKIFTPEQKAQLAQKKADGKKRMEALATKRLDGLKEKLELTDEQYATLKASQEKNKSQVQAILKNESLQKEAKKEQLAALRSEMKKTMDDVLTEAQKAKLEELKKDSKGKMEHFRGRRMQVR